MNPWATVALLMLQAEKQLDQAVNAILTMEATQNTPAETPAETSIFLVGELERMQIQLGGMVRSALAEEN